LTNKPGKLTREETLALVCALIITAILSAYSLHLKRQETAEIIIVSLSEYVDPFNVPRNRSDFVPRESGRKKRGASSTTSGSVLRVAKDSTDAGRLTESRLSLTTDSLADAGTTAGDSTSTEWSPVFRPFKRSWELDSILTMPGEPGVALLRQHVIYESRAYDTALTNHLIRLGNEFTRFDASHNLENEMRFNMGRYGSPYNPLRPQPPSAQVQVKPIVMTVLGFLYMQAKEVSAAVARAVKPREKKAPE
jgi:hypothetical protein